MTAIRDPYPETLAEVDDAALGFAPAQQGNLAPLIPDGYAVALNRIATALEQIALEIAAKPAQPVQNAPHAPLAALPPVQAQGGVCPIHGTPWKTVPAGVSKRTGTAYQAFQACSTQGCDQRPR